MDIGVVAGVVREQSRVDTLTKVNVSLLKTTNEQAQQHAAQLINSITSLPEGNKGHHINTHV